MKRHNILFVACVAFAIVLIVASLLTGIHRHTISSLIDSTPAAVVLAFDDGPNSRYAPTVLDILS